MLCDRDIWRLDGFVRFRIEEGECFNLICHFGLLYIESEFHGKHRVFEFEVMKMILDEKVIICDKSIEEVALDWYMHWRWD
jgi:hypothetical protein